MIESILKTAQNISTPVALAAFALGVAMIAFVYFVVFQARNRLKLLLALPESERGKHLPTLLRELPVPPRELSHRSHTSVLLLVLRQSFWLKMAIIVAFLLIFGSIIMLAIRQPPLPWQAAAYEIQEHRISWNLQKWSRVDRSRPSERQELATVSHSVVLQKVRDDVGYFTARIGTTSPCEPRVLASSHSVRMLPITDRGVHSARTWQLVFDISRHPTMEDVRLQFTLEYANAFQGETREWIAQTTIHPTRFLSIAVNLPQDRPATSTATFRYPRNRSDKQEASLETEDVTHSPPQIVWNIPHPHMNWNYKLEWNWEKPPVPNIAAPEPPLPVSSSDAPFHRTLDSLPAPVPGGNR